jgi:hypothetical protein
MVTGWFDLSHKYLPAYSDEWSRVLRVIPTGSDFAQNGFSSGHPVHFIDGLTLATLASIAISVVIVFAVKKVSVRRPTASTGSTTTATGRSVPI